MDSLHSILNLLLPPLTLLLLFLFSPIYFLFKVFNFVARRLHAEDVAGKVVLITGASSGIGEHLAYEYARRGACLALVARRDDRLQAVSAESRRLGSPDVLTIRADVSDIEDCNRFVDKTIHHFGKLDHLVNNAGMAQKSLFEDTRIQDAACIMNTNFWGSVYSTRFAVPHLRKSKGKIVAISSSSAKIALPITSFYSASKSALLSFYETLSVELGPDIGVTIVFPGLISTDMTTPEFVSQYGSDQSPVLVSARNCAKSIVNGVCRGERWLTEPYWVKSMFWLKAVSPEIVEWGLANLLKHQIKPFLKKGN